MKRRSGFLPALAVVGVLAASCAPSNPAGTAPASTNSPASPTSLPTSTIPVTSLPATTTTAVATTQAPGPTSQEAFQVVFGFDPGAGDPEVLAAALAVTGAHPNLGLPRFVEEGSPGVRDAVFRAMIADPVWALPTLSAMQEYGMPSGTNDAPKLWPSQTRIEINLTLAAAAQAGYGRLGEMMIDLNRRMVTKEVDACAGCTWAGGWYVIPQAITDPNGTMTDAKLFEGTVTIASDTGAGDEYPITVQRLDAWVPVQGFLAAPPAFGVNTGSGEVFEGAFVADSVVTVSGWGEAGTLIRIGDRTTTVQDNQWTLTVPIGTGNELLITGEAPDGMTRAEALTITALPGAERTFGFIVDHIGSDGSRGLVVDYAEWLSGFEATAAARADGVIAPDAYIENDFYIRNRNEALRTLPIATDVVIRLIDATAGNLTDVTVPAAEFFRMLETDDDFWTYGAAQAWTPYWFIVDRDGVIRQAQQQYTP